MSANGGTKAGVDTVTKWKLVPVEPTDDMRGAIARADWMGKSDLSWTDGWRIMLAASPTPPPAEGLAGDLRAIGKWLKNYAGVDKLATINSAADEIERLQGEVFELRAVCDSYADENQRLYDRTEAAEAKLSGAVA